MKQKISKLCSIKGVDEDQGVIKFILSKRIVDRDSEVIEPLGIDLTEFKDNPVFLWAHDSSLPSIGRVIPETLKATKEELTGDVEFDLDDPFAAMIFNKYKKGHLNAGSIRFMWKAYEREPVLEGQQGLTFSKTLLLEFSAVPVPANSAALAQDIKSYCELAEDGKCKGSAAIGEFAKELEGFSKNETFENSPYGWLEYINNPQEEELQKEIKTVNSVSIKKEILEKYNDKAVLMSLTDNVLLIEPVDTYRLEDSKFLENYDLTKWDDVANAMNDLLNLENSPKHITSYIYNELVKFYAQFEKEPPEFSKTQKIVESTGFNNIDAAMEAVIIETIKQLNEGV